MLRGKKRVLKKYELKKTRRSLAEQICDNEGNGLIRKKKQTNNFNRNKNWNRNLGRINLFPFN